MGSVTTQIITKTNIIIKTKNMTKVNLYIREQQDIEKCPHVVREVDLIPSEYHMGEDTKKEMEKQVNDPYVKENLSLFTLIGDVKYIEETDTYWVELASYELLK